MKDLLDAILTLREHLSQWFPTTNIVQLSFGQIFFRIQLLQNGLMTREYKIAWDDLRQADNPVEELRLLVSRVELKVERD